MRNTILFAFLVLHISCLAFAWDPEICAGPEPEGEPCFDETPRYYYSYKYNACRRFYPGYCADSPRLFDTLEDCKERCMNMSPRELCKLPHTRGKECYQAIRMYYYNPRLRRCVQFYYGGCNGTPNRFVTIERCQKFCGR
ncbi:BPTI/Kunitz domain-containing protein-like isoform X1 [Ornithodoros turicata]|uniref:BPTI/Kunitz domain-containing protein-like isoform X1 n=1 Tax=Ornithodoros turicata TaxID=34597 RepID=UPI003139D368